MSNATACLLRHFGNKSPIAAFREDMTGDAKELIAAGMDTDAAWLQVAEAKLADLRAEHARIEKDVADAYAKTPAGMKAAQAVARAGETEAQRTQRELDEASARRAARRQPPKGTVMGSRMLGAINDKLRGLDPSLLSEMSFKVPSGRMSKRGTPLFIWRNPMTRAGLLFRSGGEKDPALIAELLESEGYLTPDAVEADGIAAGEQAKDLIRVALDRQPVLTQDEQIAAQHQAEDEAMAASDEERNESSDPFDGLSDDDLAESEYDAASPDEQEAIQALLADAESLGIDTEALRDDAARSTEGASNAEYTAEVRRRVAEAVSAHRQTAGRVDAEAARGSGEDRGAAAAPEGGQGLTRRAPKPFEPQTREFEHGGKTYRITVDRYWKIPSVPVENEPDLLTWSARVYKEDRGARWLESIDGDKIPVAVARKASAFTENAREVDDGEGLFPSRTDSQPLLEAQSEQDLREKAAREESATKADAAEQKRLADKAKADAERDEFTLTGSDRPADVGAASGQRSVFDEPASEEVAQRPADASKVEDFGEALPPSRRKAAAMLGKALSDDDIESKPLSEIWPLAENAAIEDPFAAAVAHTARAAVPAKPRVGYKLQRWVESVKTVRSLAQLIVSGAVSREQFESKIPRTYAMEGFLAKVKLLEHIDRSQWSRIGEVRENPGAGTYVDSKFVTAPSANVGIDGRNHWLRGSGAIEDHFDAVKMMLGEPVVEKKIQFEVRGRGNSWFINRKGDSQYRPLMTFTDSKDALAARASKYDELVQAWEAIKDRDNVTERDVRSSSNKERVGKDWRKGKDVTADQFRETFGFLGGEFGKWVSQGTGAKDRQSMLNNAYDALMDLAEIVKVPPRAMSLNGTLGLAFGSRGSGWASAHFEPNNLVINLTKTRGAGALAHEWFHALDNYFARSRGGEVPMSVARTAKGYRDANFVTHKPEPMMVSNRYGSQPMSKTRLESLRRANPNSAMLATENWKLDPNHPEGVRPEVEARFADLVKALNESPMTKRAELIDKGKSDGYWSQTLERAARSFESYVISRMAETGAQNEYLANVTKLDEFPRDPGRYPYLTPAEVKPVAEAFDALFDTIKTRTDDAGNVAMYSIASKIDPASGRIPSGAVLYHGTRGKLDPNRTDPLFLTDNKADARAYGDGLIPGTGKGQSGKPTVIGFTVTDDARVLDANNRINNAVTEQSEETADEAINGAIEQAKREGYDFVWFEHPSVTGAEMNALIAVNWPDILIEGEGGPAFSLAERPFYSALSRAIEASPTKQASSEAWRLILKGMVNKGTVKADEIAWSGLDEFLQLQTGKVTREQVADYLAQNGVRVTETVLGSGRDDVLARREAAYEAHDRGEISTDERNRRIEDAGVKNTHYDQYQLPGGSRYREVLLTLPAKSSGKYWAMDDTIVPGHPRWMVASRRESDGETVYNGRSHGSKAAAEAAIQEIEGKSNYRSNHWTEPNVLAHIRMNDRVDSENRRVLFVEELQADKGQEWQKLKAKIDEGKATEADRERFAFLNKFPYNKTDAWVALTLKRIVKLAVDEGYDRVAFVNGEQSAKRYSLDKQVSKIEWNALSTKTPQTNVVLREINGRLIRFIVDGDGKIGNALTNANSDTFIGKDLQDVVGKEIAEKIMGSYLGSLEGDGLKLEQKGMRAFYDKIVPSMAKDVLRKLGGNGLTTVNLSTPAAGDEGGVWRNAGNPLEWHVDGTDEVFRTEAEAEAELKRLSGQPQPGFDITPRMREQAANGVPLFSKTAIDANPTSAQDGAYVKAGPETQALADQFAALINASGDFRRPVVLDAVTPRFGEKSGRAKELAAVSSVARRLFAHKVVFVDFGNSAPLFNGAVSSRIPGVIFLSAQAQHPLMSVFGHELLHKLKQDTPGVYRDMASKLNKLLRGENRYRDALEAKYKAHGMTLPLNWAEELHADIMGDFFADEQFWRDMAGEQPRLFKRVVDAVLKFLDDVAAEIVKFRPFGTDKYLADIKAARKAATAAMREYSGSRVGAMTSGEGGINLSILGRTSDTDDSGTPGNRGREYAQTKNTPKEIRAAKEALARIEAAGGVTSPDDLRALLRVDGYSQWAESPVARDVDATRALRRELEDLFGTTDGAPILNRQGVITPNAGWESAPRLEDLTRIADKYGAPIAVRGRVKDDEFHHARMRAAGFEPYRGMQERGSRPHQVLFSWIRPAGGISAVTPLFSIAPQTDSAAFKKWFGDSVVTVDGKAGSDPLVVYHGTGKDFAAFDDTKIVRPGYGLGHHFAEDPKLADFYAAQWASGERGSGDIVMPVYLSIKKAFTGDYYGEMHRRGIKGHSAMRDALVADGYDGLRYNHGDGENGASKYAWVVFRPEQIKSATGNRGTFDASSPDIRYSIASTVRNFGGGPKIIGQTQRQYTPEQSRAMRSVGFEFDRPTLEQRVKEYWKDAGKKLAQGLVDQFAPVKDISAEAYGLLRLAKGASGALETFLHGGMLKLTNGVYDFDDANRGGVIETLFKPLQGEHHDFLRWVAANRAERLASEGKENLFSDEDIDDLKSLSDGTTDFDYTIQNGAQAGQTTRDRSLIYADSLKTFNGFNKNVLDMAEQSGLIDAESRQVWEHEFYVPFYRVADEDGGIRGMNVKSGAVRQEAFKALKGGRNALNPDLLDNTLMNWAHLLDAAAKNRAASATLQAAESVGAAISSTESAVRDMGAALQKKNGVVWVMEDGVKRYYLIEDPHLVTALTALDYAGMRGPMMDAMSTFKRALTIGVTASPFFKIRNLIRDSVQAIGAGPLEYNPLANVKQGWALTNPKSDAYFRLLAGGGTIHFGTMMEGNEAKRVQALIESGVNRSTILGDDHAVKAFYRKYIEPSITAYNELGNRGEAVNRASLYAQLRSQGMNHAQASLQARDLMDFSMQGSFASVRFLTQVVPFLNARLQGLYKLGRAAKEDPARMGIVMGATAMASLALLLAYHDDDDWKKREDWDRNNFWWFKFAGTAFRIPKPFEIGAVASLAERGFEVAFSKEMTGKRFGHNVLQLLGDNLAMNPIPQLAKPMLDVYANKDAFTGRPIETMGMERLMPEYRFTGRTSMFSRGASTAANAVAGTIGAQGPSPVQIDHMIRGYFGWLGTFIVGAADVIARPATGQVSQPLPDVFRTATGNMVSDLRDAPSRYVSQMYQQARELEEAYGTWKALIAAGKGGEAAEFREANQDALARYRMVERTKSDVSKINARIRMIEQSDIGEMEKRLRIREASVQKDRLARVLESAN